MKKHSLIFFCFLLLISCGNENSNSFDVSKEDIKQKQENFDSLDVIIDMSLIDLFNKIRFDIVNHVYTDSESSIIFDSIFYEDDTTFFTTTLLYNSKTLNLNCSKLQNCVFCTSNNKNNNLENPSLFIFQQNQNYYFLEKFFDCDMFNSIICFNSSNFNYKFIVTTYGELSKDCSNRSCSNCFQNFVSFEYLNDELIKLKLHNMYCKGDDIIFTSYFNLKRLNDFIENDSVRIEKIVNINNEIVTLVDPFEYTIHSKILTEYFDYFNYINQIENINYISSYPPYKGYK